MPKFYFCRNCGWKERYRGGRKRKKCPKCGFPDLKIIEANSIDEIQEETIDEKMEERKEEIINEQLGKKDEIIIPAETPKLVDEKEINNLSNKFFRLSEENFEMVDSNSDYYPFIKLLVEQAYKPKQIKPFKPSDGAIRQYAKLLELNYPQSRIQDPRTALIVSTIILFAPAIVYYGNELLKKLRLFRKNAKNENQNQENQQNKENMDLAKKQNHKKKELNILDIK